MKNINKYIIEKFKISKDVRDLDATDINQEYKRLFDVDGLPSYDLDIEDCIENEYDIQQGKKYILLSCFSLGWAHPLKFKLAVIQIKKIDSKEKSYSAGYSKYRLTLYCKVLYTNSNSDDLSIDRKFFTFQNCNTNFDMLYDRENYRDDRYLLLINPKYNEIFLDELEYTNKIIGNRFFNKKFHDDIDDYEKDDRTGGHDNWEVDTQWSKKLDFSQIRNLLK